MVLILGIESSCDETAMAVLKDGKELLSNIVSSQIDTHALYGGVVPEIASRLHVQNVSVVLEQALTQAGVTIDEIDAIAVTQGPGLVGSLHVGLQAAKTLAAAFHKPLIGVHHIAGHIYANALVKEITYPMLSLVVSGGHTELVYVKDAMQFEIIGTTFDDAVGEANDKVARVLNLPYPGGPQIDKLAALGKPNYKLPKPLDDKSYNFSFSGLKSAVINLVHNIKQRNEEIIPEDLCFAFQNAWIDVIINKTRNAAKEYGVKQISIAGGVAANKGLRTAMTEMVEKDLLGTDLILPPLWCCTDNAAMIAMAGHVMHELGLSSPLDLGVKPGFEME